MASVQSMTVARIRNMNRIALTEQLYLFSEELFSEIKNWGTIDYEEYWNRKLYNTETQSGHYLKPSGMGNYWRGWNIDPTTYTYWDWMYYCRSGNTTPVMGTGWCAWDAWLNSMSIIMSGSMQRYGQYAEQFWDRNSNKNDDQYNSITLFGDQDGNGNILWDEDDRNIWDWPTVFSGSIYELYLTDKQRDSRTFFRWNIVQDPNTTDSCTISTTATGQITTSDGCLWNIQVLKLKWYDFWEWHTGSPSSTGAFDGKIDTWVCDTASGWRNCTWQDIGLWNIATGSGAEWINLFPSSINVRNFRLTLFPEKDPWLAVAAPDCSSADTTCISPFIHPYARISLELGFAHGKRRSLKNENPVISTATTISLDDFR